MTTAPMDPATISAEDVKELLDWELKCGTKMRTIKYLFRRWVIPLSPWEACPEPARWIAHLPCCEAKVFYYACHDHKVSNSLWLCEKCGKNTPPNKVRWEKL